MNNLMKYSISDMAVPILQNVSEFEFKHELFKENEELNMKIQKSSKIRGTDPSATDDANDVGAITSLIKLGGNKYIGTSNRMKSTLQIN